MRTMCRLKLLFFLIVAWLSTMTAVAQDSPSVNLVDSVEEIYALCPISFSPGWGINSVTMIGNNYSLVDFEVPASLTMVLPTLANDSDKVKRLWVKQLDSYGGQWKRFVDLMVVNDCRIVINLRPKGSDDTYLITFYPSDFKK